ncbi:MAG: hypothetical protein HY908_00385 [Myxococcales bacterium]|nr:hypothetical protein [Myxococcales bacterium]
MLRGLWLAVALAVSVPAARADACSAAEPIDFWTLDACLRPDTGLSRPGRLALVRALGRVSGAARPNAIALLLRAAITDDPPYREAVARSLVRLRGLTWRAALRLPSRREVVGRLAAHDFDPEMIYLVVVVGEPIPGTLRLAAVPERCDDDFYVWATLDVGPKQWSLLEAGVGHDC